MDGIEDDAAAFRAPRRVERAVIDARPHRRQIIAVMRERKERLADAGKRLISTSPARCENAYCRQHAAEHSFSLAALPIKASTPSSDSEIGFSISTGTPAATSSSGNAEMIFRRRRDNGRIRLPGERGRDIGKAVALLADATCFARAGSASTTATAPRLAAFAAWRAPIEPQPMIRIFSVMTS